MSVRRRYGARVLVVAVLVLTGAGCGTHQQDESLLGDGSSASPTVSASTAPAPATVAELLRQRADAVLAGDRKAFLASVSTDQPGFRAQQRRLFDNLRLLPVQDLSFSRAGPQLIQRTLTLHGFDTGPLVEPAGFAVVRRAGRWVVVPPVSADQRPTDPWDLTEIRVLRTPRVLLIAGRSTTAAEEARVLAAFSDSVNRVRDLVPSTWDGTAVAYLFSDPVVLASYDRVPGGTLERLGAVTFPVRGAGRSVVGGRIALLPAALRADQQGLKRLVRHELTHVALGTADDAAPTWLVEGVAEYVAAQPIPPARQRIATSAVRRAEAGLFELPAAASFNGRQQDLHYAEAWMACDYLAATQGPSILFDLIQAMDQAHVGRSGVGQDAVLRRMVGYGARELARRAGVRTVSLFGSTPSPDPTPTTDPSDASATAQP